MNRTVRFVHGTLQAAGLTLGMFGMPVWLLGLGAFEYTPDLVVETSEERVVYLPPPPAEGGGAPEVAETEQAEAPVSDSLASTAGKRLPTGKASTGTVHGMGPGSGGGFSHRMPRPDDAPDGPSAERASRGRGSRDCADPTDMIAKTGPTSWSVERAFVDTYAGHPGRIDELGSVGKHEGADGKADGFKLYGIQCGTPLHQAGLRSGDVVHSINGEEVTNVLQAIRVYSKLRRADALEVVITRKGERKTLSYAVV